MSHIPQGCGLASKPRSAQPSMFQILSWAGQNNLSESKFVQGPIKQEVNQSCCCQQTKNSQIKTIDNQKNNNQNCCCVKNVAKPTEQQKQVKFAAQEIYKQHKSPSKPQANQKNVKTNIIQTAHENQDTIFKKSKVLYNKQIKHELYSVQPVNLKASRSRSAVIVQKDEIPQKKTKNQVEVNLDEKTIEERKQRLKQFELFTRVLPNSSFTTYYGKPAFENYGRGTSCKNLKSFNVMPHKGANHPQHAQSHYTALIKARNIKSKSHMPRKPIQQPIIPSNVQEENQQTLKITLPLQKPDLIKSNRFATIVADGDKKAGPPPLSKTTIQVSKNGSKGHKKQPRNPKSKSFKQTISDGLKFMTKRENLIDLLEEKKLKASQLAYKVTECYPLEFQPEELAQSAVSKENWQHLKPAGKHSTRCDKVADLIQSRFVLQDSNNKSK